jgi:hypothetical protein
MSSTTTATPYPQAGGKLPPEHDGFAIASLVTAFFVPILGIIFGHLSNHRAKLAHRAKSGLAVAGLVLGYLFTAISALIIVIVVAVAGSTTPSVTANAAPPASSAPASPAAPAAPKAPSTMGLAPGQSVTVKDSVLGYHGTVTITGAKVVTGPQTEFGSAPTHGHFVIATVKAAATSGGQLNINPFDFYAKAAGQHISTTDGNAMGAIDSSQELTASTLNGGETATGQIVFDVPSAHGQIVYAPGLNSQALASWNY